MAIETTLNIRRSILMQIELSSQISGLSNNEIISQLLKRAVQEYQHLFFKGTRRIKYQDRAERNQWKKEHVRYSEIEYDYILDLKKLYKMSASHILAYMVKHFLKKELYKIMHKKINNKTDNYRLTSYAVIHEVVKNSICWKIYWGIPHPPELLIT